MLYAPMLYAPTLTSTDAAAVTLECHVDERVGEIHADRRKVK